MTGPDEPDLRRREALDAVRRRLVAAGATEAEIDQAVRDDVLDLLAVDRLFIPASRRYSQREVAELTGMPLALLRRFWRALGFNDAPEDAPIMTDTDIMAIHQFQGLITMEPAQVEAAVELARVIGSSMARIAEAEVLPGSLIQDAEGDSVLGAERFVNVADVVLPAMGALLEFVWRRHVQAATERAMLLRARGNLSGTTAILAVGFADMVGFTLLSQHLREDELAAVVHRFEDISYDTVAMLGGRVVKMIGDEVMFVVDDATAAVRIGLRLAEAYADDDLLSDVRVGLALGPVLIREGDYFGATVNLAHRIVNIANPGTVLVSESLHERLSAEAPGEFSSRALGRQVLKDLGPVRLWWYGTPGRRPDESGVAGEDGRGDRLQRLNLMLQELEELRGFGEQLAGERTGAAGSALSGARQAEGGDPERP